MASTSTPAPHSGEKTDINVSLDGTHALKKKASAVPSSSGSDNDDSTKDGQIADQSRTSQDSVAVLDARLKRKMFIMDLRITIWFGIIYLLSFFWRSNIGNGNLETITPTITVSVPDYDKAFATFFVCFILWTIPAVLIQEKLVKPRYWISFNMLILAGAQIGMGFVTNAARVLVVRFFLGFGEAGLLAGMILFILQWYRTFESAFRVGAFFGIGILIGSLSGILAFLLNLILEGEQGKSGWQWILLTVGLVTFAVAVLSFVLIPDLPSQARELDADEKVIIAERVEADRLDYERSTESVVSALIGAFTDWKAWAFVAMATALFIPIYCFYPYSTTLATRFQGGNISVRFQLTVVVPPYVLAFCAILATGWYSDKMRKREPFIVGSLTVAIIGFIMMLANSASGKRIQGLNYFATHLVCAGLYSACPLILVWGTENQHGALRRAVVCGMICSFSQIGGVTSRYILNAGSAPGYTKGMGVCLAMTILCGLIAAAMSGMHRRLNAISTHALTT